MDLTRLIGERDKLIDDLNGGLESIVAKTQKSMLDKFMVSFVDKLQFDENGAILNNDHNRKLLLDVDRLFTDFTKENAPKIIGEIAASVGSILNYNSKYYNALDGKADLIPIRKKVQDSVSVWLGVKDGKTAANGYLDTLVKNDTSRNLIKNAALKSILSQDGYNATKTKLREIIDGDSEKLGALQKYYRNFTYDLYSQVDRATAKTYADDLKFNFAIYEGGLIETSREFCKDHNGKVYHKTEIEKFKLTEAEPPNYNPFTDLGGYGCRHHLNWIPDSLAVAMRPDARKFIEEKKTEPKPDKKKAEKPKKAEPKKIEEPAKPKTESLDKLIEKHSGLSDYVKESKVDFNPEFFKHFKSAVPITHNKTDEAYYSYDEKTILVGKGRRYKSSDVYKEKIIYHEYGHALDAQHGWRRSEIVKNTMEAIRKEMKADNSSGYRDLDAKVKEFNVYDQLENGKRRLNWAKAEEQSSIADTLMSLNSQYGFGHTKSYFKDSGASEAEFIAHAFEVKFMKSTEIWDEIAPELKNKLIKMIDELLASVDK